jgi:hypothetical protein
MYDRRLRLFGKMCGMIEQPVKKPTPRAPQPLELAPCCSG